MSDPLKDIGIDTDGSDAGVGSVGDMFLDDLKRAGYQVTPSNADNPPTKPPGETLGELIMKLPSALFNPGRVGGKFQ